MYDPKLARLLAEASQNAYLAEAPFKVWAHAAGYPEVEPFVEGDTQAYGCANDSHCFIVFRGTEPDNLKDWATDSELQWHTHLDGYRVHTGFYKAFQSIQKEFTSWLVQTGAKPLSFAGHSLGGALAVLAADAWANRSPTLYTIGQPRVGDNAFAQSVQAKLGDNYHRFVHHRDIVARVPLFSVGFLHFGNHWYVKDGIATLVASGVENEEAALQSVFGSNFDIPDSFLPHLKRIFKAIEESFNPEALAGVPAALQSVENKLNPLAKIIAQPIFTHIREIIQKFSSQQGGNKSLSDPVRDHSPVHYVSAFPPL
jgi:triacylglycerol lipase